jgi:hypothetical protein
MNINVKKNLITEEALDDYDKRQFNARHYKGHRYFAILEGKDSHTVLYFGFTQWRKVERRIQWLQSGYDGEDVIVKILKF